MLYSSLMGEARELDVQGHRGNRTLRPENTLPSFMAAIEAGASTLELDILVTADNQLVIHHDFFVNKELCVYLDGRRVTEEVLVRSLTLAELKKLDAGSRINPLFPGQVAIPGTQIPTLQELFELINTSSHPNAKKIGLNLEIKRDLRFPDWTLPPEKLADAITTQVRRNGLSDRVYYSSFDPEVLAALHKIEPTAKTAFIFCRESLEVASILHPEAGMEFLLKIASMLHVSILSPDHHMLKSKADVLFLQKQGFKVIPWTVNDPKRWAELAEMGVDGIISDDPIGLIQFLKDFPKQKALDKPPAG
jgi:glycerophosphoryl diester phosphodiesterase